LNLIQRRVLFASAFFVTVALGLASRKIPGLFPPRLGKYPGDALWAVMVFFAWGFLIPEASTTKLALYALITSYADELSQLYQAEWINEIRRSAVGHLILGSAFSWLDMLAYTVSVGAVVVSRTVYKLVIQRLYHDESSGMVGQFSGVGERGDSGKRPSG
jgi:hypothetical protein